MRSRTLKVTVTMEQNGWTLSKVHWATSYLDVEAIRAEVDAKYPDAYGIRMAIVEGARRRPHED